ncbi:unnamed protein product [Clavelina lepadiformis]|uniref:Ribosomal protein L20 n=1 Tax=Clavelina lepadiformis TaxID=159417 RepID=A0ABP0FBZ7_CLALP
MFLTALSWMYRVKPPVRDRWWKIQRLKEQGRHFWFQSLRARVGLSRIFIRRALVNQTKARLARPYMRNKFRSERLESAVKEYGVKPNQFRVDLHSAGVKLNKNMLNVLSIYEPRTFERITELAQRSQIEKIYKNHVELPKRSFTSAK